MLTGADYWHLRARQGIGMRTIRTSDGPVKVRGPRWDERDTALNAPAPVAFAASAVERPARWLAGFAKATALAGAEAMADIAVPLRCLAHWDTTTGLRAVEPGDYRLAVGRSSRDLPLSVPVTIGPSTGIPGGLC